MQKDLMSAAELLLQGVFHIESTFAQSELANYLHELRLVEVGVPYAELGISARRHTAQPIIISLNDGGYTTATHTSLVGASASRNSVAHLRLQGTMRVDDGPSARGIQSLIDDINAVNANPNIGGILLEVNTGGGESLAGSMLQAAILDCSKPVVVYAHLLCSAGIMATLGASEIIASHSEAIFGSIGTFVSLSKTFVEDYKASVEDVYADKSPNKNKAFRDYLSGDLTELVTKINATNDAFLSDVRKHRALRGDAATIENTLSGATFTAFDAKKRGLCDSIGGFNHALTRLMVNVNLHNQKKISAL